MGPEMMSPFESGDAPLMEQMDPDAMAMAGEYLGDQEDISEPAPRPIDWRVKRFWDDKKDRHRLGRWLVEEIRRARQAFSWRLDNCKQWRDDFEMMPSAADHPYTGAATCCAPFTRYACAAHSRQLNTQIVEPEPIVTVEPLDMEAMEDALAIEEAINAKIEESEWAKEARALHDDLPQVGNGYFRVEYERRVKRAPKLKFDQEEEDYAQTVQALRLAGVDLITAQTQALPRDKDGAIRYTLEWDEIVDYAGTGYKFIPFEDGVVFPATCRDATKARGIGERFVISGLDLEQGAKNGLFIRSEIDELLKLQGDEQPDGRQDRLDASGLEIADAQGPLGDDDAKYRDYLCWRLSVRLDGDDDGEEEIILVTIHEETERILDIRYSQYEHGSHIYHLAPFEARPGELLGRGIAELVATIQDDGTALLNQLANHGDLVINANATLIVDDTAMLDPDVQILQMGTIFRVRDIRGVREWPITALPAEAYNRFQQLKDMVDLIAGVSNPSLGKATDTQRTAREVTIVASNASANFEGVAQGLSLFWARVWDQARSIEAQFARDGQIQYRRNRMARAEAQGPQDAFGTIDAKRLLAKVRALPAGVRQLSDMQSRMSQAMAMNAAFASNPVVAQNPAVWRLAIEATMEAAKYAPKEKVLLAIDQAAEAAQQAAMQQQMAQEQGQMAMTEAGLPPELLQLLQSLPPEILKGLMAQATSASGEKGATGQAPPPGAAGPEQGGPMLPGMLG
jgi:hypothetical protein